MNDIISIISLLSIYIFGLAVIAYTFADIGRTANQRKYEKKLKEAILYGEFKNNDIYLLAKRWSVRHEDIEKILLFIFNDFLTDKNCHSHHCTRIRELIEWHDKHAPLSDLPDDIKLQLQHILRLSDTCEPEVISLTKSLHDIYNSSQKKAKRVRIINFVLGTISIASFCITLYEILSK